MIERTKPLKDEINKLNNFYLLTKLSTKNNNNSLFINQTGGLNKYLVLEKIERRNERRSEKRRLRASNIFTKIFFILQLFFVLFINSEAQQNKIQVQGIAEPTTLLQQQTTSPQNPGIISRVSRSGLNLLADYLRLRVLRFTRSNALQYNFSVPLPSHNVEISINSLDIVNFDTNAFQSRLGVSSTKELVWIGSEFRAAINTQIQLKMLIERRELFATQQVPLRLEKVRIELVLGPGVNADGHLRTDILQCRIVSGELLFENLFRDAANLSSYVPLVHQVTLTKLSEMICPVFVAELGPVVANRLLNSPLSTALFDHYFLNFGLTSNYFLQI
uniref:Uncharacterized protein n=1 Tax=Meloidogyne enterolobii TaxID=390850 RepID=A0A6V7TI01_MELEN|nr:unnamed protein product [Meloidogyne enterolobii]